MSKRDFGQELLEHLTSNSFVSAQNTDGQSVLFVWNSNAAEQLEAWLFKNAPAIYIAAGVHYLKSE